MMTKRKRKKTGRIAAARICAACLLTLFCSGQIRAENKKPSPPAAVIAGTVFRDTGLSLRGAIVTVKGAEKGKKKEWKAVADGRGEFVVRVPAGPADYNVTVTAAGYRTYEKAVTLAADERIDLSIILETDSRKQQ